MGIDKDMKLLVNKKEEYLDDGITVSQLLQIRKMKKAAVWVNGIQLLRAQYEDHILREGDEVKLLRIVAGG